MSLPLHSLPDSDEHRGRGASALARVWWLALGNLAVAFTALEIALDPRGGFGALDALFWGLALSLLAVRYVDLHHLGGLDAEGRPATPATWRRYALVVAAASLLLWVAAHAAGRLLH